MVDLVILSESTGKRLDKFLQEQYPSFSRSQLQKAIKEGCITVNGISTSVHHFLKANDHVHGSVDAPTTLVCTPNQALRIPIIAETDDVIIIDKPSGMLVHQAEGHREPDTVANWLVAHAPAIATIGEDSLRPGIVHRLDSDVSGVMVIAKTQPMFERLKRAFAERRIEKQYMALVYGTMEQVGGIITFPIARSETKEGRMAARPKDAELLGEGKEAVTEYMLMRQYQQYALLDVRPKTGRTHQIRVHLYASGHPIVGDPLYKPKDERKQLVPRIFLHATSLSFTDLQGMQQVYKSPLPKELEQILEQLQNKS